MQIDLLLVTLYQQNWDIFHILRGRETKCLNKKFNESHENVKLNIYYIAFSSNKVYSWK